MTSLDLARLIESWSRSIPESMQRADLPGLAIGIVDTDGPRWTAGFGTTARGDGSPITPATRFSVQSTSKLVTATTMMTAVRDGLIDLDVPIAKYLPDFTVHSVFDKRPQDLITLRHLLSHTAGFTHEAPVGSNYDVGNGDYAEHCRSIARTWLRFPVGHHFEYSNLGIDLASYALERVTGVPFAQYASRELFDRIGMGRSTFDPTVMAADPSRAVGHWQAFDDVGAVLPIEVPMVGSGGLYTCVDDLLQFVRLHLRHGAPILTAEALHEQYRVPFADVEQRLGYGLGIYADEWSPGVRVRHHGGSGFGFHCQVCWIPEASIGCVVLTNSYDHDLQNELAHEFVEFVARERHLPPTPRPGRVEAVTTDLDDLVGEYVGRLASLRVDKADTGWVVTRVGSTHPVRAIGPRTIEIQDADRTRLRARGSNDSSVKYLTDLRNGDTYYRNDVTVTRPSILDPAFLGLYTVSAWGVPFTEYELRQDGPSPVIRNEGGPAIRLTEIRPHLYLSSTGEVLDLAGAQPSYANIRLDRASDGATTA